MPTYDTIIRGGTIIDGMRMPRYQADVGITDGRIAAIGRLRPHDGATVLDANGLIVAPGFIDLHTHYDAQVFWDPYCSISSWHGITSVVIGNCGFGFAPVRPAERQRSMLTMTRVEAIPLASMQAGMPWDWETYPEFLDSLERTPKGINVLPFMPVAPLLTYVMGLEAAKTRMPSPDEERRICRLLHEALDAGACGWSAQRLPPTGPACVQRDYDGTPMVTDVMSDDTCLALARVLGERSEGFIQMTLTSDNLQHDLQHFEDLAALSGRPILYNVVQCNDRHPHRHRRLLNWLDACRQKGLRIYGQAVSTDVGFTFTFEDWNLFDDSDVWCEVTTGSHAEKLAKLSDPSRREALRTQLPTIVLSSFDDVFIIEALQPELKSFENLSLQEAAERMGKHPIDAMLDLTVADDLRTTFYLPGLNRRVDLLQELVDYEWALFGVSDGGAHTKFFTAGRYPTETITRMVRQHNMLSLEDAHWRLSALPAWCAGFHDRGMLREGAPADIVVYDYDHLTVTPTEVAYDLPGGEWRRVQRAEGYRWILVNGQITFTDGQGTEATPGKLLRHGRG
jgi:N-acyl-D-aspartate/D-glutamate deacylase